MAELIPRISLVEIAPNGSHLQRDLKVAVLLGGNLENGRGAMEKKFASEKISRYPSVRAKDEVPRQLVLLDPETISKTVNKEKKLSFLINLINRKWKSEIFTVLQLK